VKTYKTWDIILQLAAIAFMVVGNFLEIPGLFIGIFLLGFIQIVSALVHIGKRHEPWISKLRIIYYLSLLLPVGGFIAAILQKPEDKYDMAGIEEMIFVLIVSILIALFYLVICSIELRRLRKIN